MLNRTDRREWAALGLIALGWALLVAPVLHRETHAHGTQHSHGPAAPGTQHGAGSLEHQALAFLSTPAVVSPVGVFFRLGAVEQVVPAVVVARAWRRVAVAQGP